MGITQQNAPFLIGSFPQLIDVPMQPVDLVSDLVQFAIDRRYVVSRPFVQHSIVIGPGKLSQLGGALGQSVKGFRKSQDDSPPDQGNAGK